MESKVTLLSVCILAVFWVMGCSPAKIDCTKWNSIEFFNEATPQIVEGCMDSGASPNIRGEAGITPLHWAAGVNSDPKIVGMLLESGADLNARTEKSKTAKFRFALAKTGVSPVIIELDDEAGETPLHWAAGFNENPEVIFALVKAGADLDARSLEYGLTPLHMAAAFNRNPHIVTTLLDSGAALNVHDEENMTPLHMAAAFNRNPQIITKLLETGADLNAGKNGWTALHAAAEENSNPAVTQVLIDAGADLEARAEGIYSDTALYNAVQQNENPAVIKVLIEAESNAGILSRERLTNLLLPATRGNRSPLVIETLIKAGADPKVRYKSLGTPLHLAVKLKGNLAVVNLLLKTGVDLNSRNGIGETPLDIAAGANSPELVRALVKAGANLDTRDNYGWTPLHSAVSGTDANPEIVVELIEAGADLNARTVYGKTPLHLAASSSPSTSVISYMKAEERGRVAANRVAIIKLLLDAGADLKAQDENGETPWDGARENSLLKGTEVWGRLNDARF